MSSSDFTDRGGVVHSATDAERRRRIVSLVPSLTETLCEVGGRARLMGCTAFCIRPKDVLKDPSVIKVGGTKTVNRERVMALNPDLLLVNLEENELADIDFFKARVECYVNGVKTVAEGIHSIREVAMLIGTPDKAEEFAGRAELALAKLIQQSKDKTPRRLFYPIWKDPWMSINRDTFIHDHLRLCGAENIFSGAPERYPVITLEQVRAANPEIVWLPSEPFVFKQKHAPELAALLPNARIELVDGDNVCWFGTRQIEGMEYTGRQMQVS